MELFECIPCNYDTRILCNYKRHCISNKHNKIFNKEFTCSICNKIYYNRSSLWHHNKKCKSQLEILTKNTKEEISNIKDEFKYELTTIKETITQNTDELKEELQQVKTAMENVKPIHNHFNLNIFLNEKCKNALNWDDFIKNLEITFDVDATMTENISRMLCNGINELGLYDRPIHCTDAKRKKLYIKKNNEWNKDKTTISKTTNKLQQRFNDLITTWEEENPNWRENEEQMMEYVQLMNKLGEEINESKCINKIIKTSVIPKDHSIDLIEES